MMLPNKKLHLAKGSLWLAFKLSAALAVSIGFAGLATGQTGLNDRPIQGISIVFPTGGPSPADEEEFHSIAQQAVGSTYSSVRVRDSIEALHKTNKVVAVDV